MMTRFLHWLEDDFMDRSMFHAMFVFFLFGGFIVGIVIGIAWVCTLIFGDGEQQQIDFVNACNSSGRVAAIQYEHVLHGKSYTWEPNVRCVDK